MSRKEYQAFLISPDTWVIHETEDGKRIPDVSACYLLAGSRQGLLVDTGDGAVGENLRNYAQTLTRRPVRMVAHTSTRAAYTGRDKDFKCIFLSDRTEPEKARPEAGVRRVPVNTGYKIDLGERVLEMFDLNGYGKGCMAVLDHKERLLFTGESMVSTDETEAHCGGILYDPESGSYGSLYEYMKNLAALLSRRTQYDLVCWGRGSDYPLDANVVEFTMNAVIHALENDGTRPFSAKESGFPDGEWAVNNYKYARIVFRKDLPEKTGGTE